MNDVISVINLLIATSALTLAVLNTLWMRRRPKLQIVYRDQTPFKKHLTVNRGTDTVSTETFIRIRVSNGNRALAKSCSGKLVHLYTNKQRVEAFDPVKLHWAPNRPDDDSPIDLAYGEFEYLDIVRTQSDKKKIKIYTNTHKRGTLRELSPGVYIFQVVVYCANESSTSCWFRVDTSVELAGSDEPWVSMEKLTSREAANLVVRM